MTAASHDGVASVSLCPGCVLCAAEVWRDTSVSTALCARVPCSGCPVCAPERRALAERIATPDDTAMLLRAEVLRLAPQHGIDPAPLAARPCTRTWWEWLALALRSGGDPGRPIPVARSHHDIANACEHASEGFYGTAAAQFADVSGETLDEWRARVRAQTTTTEEETGR